MTALHTYFFIVVNTQRGCHTLKKKKLTSVAKWNYFQWSLRDTGSISYTAKKFSETDTKMEKKFIRYFFIIIGIQPLGRFGQRPELKSSDWYSSGTLHPGQVLKGRLPLLSPAF